jgi:hypothetical protein
MKTIVDKDTAVSTWLFDDSTQVFIGDDVTVVGPLSKPELYIDDLTSSNSILIEGVANTKSAWVGGKFIYRDGEWSDNPDYVEPQESNEEQSE